MQRRKYALLKQPFELDALGDVSLTNPVLGDVMYYDGSFWINTPYAELVDDRVAALLVAGNNIDITYNDGAGTITIDVETLTSADISDFNEAVDDRVGNLLVAGSNITLTYNDVANTLTVAAATPALNDLTDVDTTGAADGDALIYDSGTSTWVAGAVAGSSPTTTAGDIIVRGASADERLAIGSSGQILTVVSGAPAWASAPSGGGSNYGAAVSRSTTQSFGTGTPTAVSFDTEIRDDGGFYDGANPTRLTVPTGQDGWYYIVGSVHWAANNSGGRRLYVRLNGSTILARQGGPSSSVMNDQMNCVSIAYYLAAGDYVEIVADQNCGSSLNTQAGTAVASIARIGIA